MNSVNSGEQLPQGVNVSWVAKNFLLFFLPLVSIVCYANTGANEYDHAAKYRYITQEIAEYGMAVERCNNIASQRPLPKENVMDSLRQYDIKKVRGFLVTQSTYQVNQCLRPELTELAYAIGMLEATPLSDNMEKIIKNIKILVFSEASWALKKAHMQLPKEIKKTLGELPYFQKPFDDGAILRALNDEGSAKGQAE